MPIWSRWAMTAPMAGSRPSCVHGRPSASASADQRPRHIRAAGLSAGRGLPVRLERGLGGSGRRAHQAAGGAYQAVAQPGVHRAGLFAADPRDAVRCADPGVPGLGRRAAARDLRQYEDRGRSDRVGQGAAGQCPVRGDGQPLPVRARVLQSGLGLGEGTGREERAGCTPPAVAEAAQLPRPGGAECLAGGALHRAMGPDPAWRPARHDRRCACRGSRQPDADGPPLRRLRRAHQARIADLPDTL